MTKPTASGSVSSFADLPELYAELTATTPFEASFGDPIPLSIAEPHDEPAEHLMPEPIAAQAECAGVVASIFDLFNDTRMEPLAPEIAWGFVNSFHFVAGKLERREDDLADRIRDMARRLEPGEVFTKELEDTQLECQSTAEQRAAVEAMRDYAGLMYRTYTGKPWSPARGSRASQVTSASQISALDFLRARYERRQERYDPKGPIVVVSGPSEWHDWQILWNRLDQIKARIPNLVLVTTGQRLGFDASAASWASQRGVPCIGFGLYGRGDGKAFKRNRQIADLMPVEAIICEGSGIQAGLYDLFNPQHGHRVPTHVFMKADQSADVPVKRKRSYIAA
ncbi:DUF2493 domain-containing protein [Sphingomonas abietis]|uniref:DUF2493 domain-containing protein n=1 Tax=Sphingomonas abietis TaxID=3012344 RepID=A0ABY7NJJ6_9SPHN|nr:DUF2493 domain-containing protein [Sphingomonas abietis]WBO21715.1 DUF2493 domain-containing protein [Sphingomonas abietis]